MKTQALASIYRMKNLFTLMTPDKTKCPFPPQEKHPSKYEWVQLSAFNLLLAFSSKKVPKIVFFLTFCMTSGVPKSAPPCSLNPQGVRSPRCILIWRVWADMMIFNT